MYAFVVIWTLLALIALIGLKPYFVSAMVYVAVSPFLLLKSSPLHLSNFAYPPPTPFPQLVCLVALSLNVSNVIGYMKCSKDAAKKIKEYAGAYVGQQIGQQLISRMLSRTSGGEAEEEPAAASTGGKMHQRP